MQYFKIWRSFFIADDADKNWAYWVVAACGIVGTAVEVEEVRELGPVDIHPKDSAVTILATAGAVAAIKTAAAKNAKSVFTRFLSFKQCAAQ